MSLLSRVMSSRLSRGTYNGGLLSTEAGTLARVVADATITLAGYLGESKLLNVTLFPSLFICVISIIATCFTYNTLYWFIFIGIRKMPDLFPIQNPLNFSVEVLLFFSRVYIDRKLGHCLWSPISIKPHCVLLYSLPPFLYLQPPEMLTGCSPGLCKLF